MQGLGVDNNKWRLEMWEKGMWNMTMIIIPAVINNHWMYTVGHVLQQRLARIENHGFWHLTGPEFKLFWSSFKGNYPRYINWGQKKQTLFTISLTFFLLSFCFFFAMWFWTLNWITCSIWTKSAPCLSAFPKGNSAACQACKSCGYVDVGF